MTPAAVDVRMRRPRICGQAAAARRRGRRNWNASYRRFDGHIGPVNPLW